MRRICAWCDKPLRKDEGLEGPVTHGICQTCKEIYEASLKEAKKNRVYPSTQNKKEETQ